MQLRIHLSRTLSLRRSRLGDCGNPYRGANSFFRGAALAFAISFACTPVQADTLLVPLQEVRYVMGTLLDITLYHSDEEAGRKILNEGFAVAERLDSLLSNYNPSSEVSRFNAAADTKPFTVSRELYRMVERSKKLSRETEGAFDITIRPVVELWMRAAEKNVMPTEEEIEKTRLLVDSNALKLVPPDKIERGKAGMKIESGGIGKGFAVDEIVKLFRGKGIERAFINFGRSSMAAIGHPPGKVGWEVLLELEEGKGEEAIVLRDRALSVSRAKGRTFSIADRIFAHIFDSKTGRPVPRSRGGSVTSDSATDGEAFSKYLVLRGQPGEGVSRKMGCSRVADRSSGGLTGLNERIVGILRCGFDAL